MAAACASTSAIGTHSGTFHCDEALAVGILRMTKEFSNWNVVRTRDETLLASLPIVVDVGGTYEPAKHRYDHHQRGFEETWDASHKTKLSSAGLIYRHFGREVVAAIIGEPAATPELVDLVYQRMYDSLIEFLDGVDNGVSRYPPDIKPAYAGGGTDLPARVARLNPAWNQDEAEADHGFEKAVAVATGEFVEQTRAMATIWWPARAIVQRSLAAALVKDPSGAIVELERFCPWEAHLFELEAEARLAGAVKYVVFEDTNHSWRVRAMSAVRGGFECRAPLPAAWRGLRDEALSSALELPGCIFVHMTGFIGGHATRDGALAMAAKALAASATA